MRQHACSVRPLQLKGHALLEAFWVAGAQLFSHPASRSSPLQRLPGERGRAWCSTCLPAGLVACFRAAGRRVQLHARLSPLPVCTGQDRCLPPSLQVFDTQLLIARFDLDDYVWASITLYLDGAPPVVWESGSNAVQQW